MKENLKNIFKARRELVIFAGVLLVTLITIALVAKFSVESDTTPIVDIIEQPGNNDNDNNGGNEPTPPEPTPKETAVLPYDGDCVVVREYFDISDETTMVNAIISNGNYRRLSKGLGYARENQESFDVCSILSGEVASIDETGLFGTCVTINHDNGITSKYYALSSFNVEVGDSVSAGDVIGVSGKSLMESSFENYVYLEVTVNGVFTNPKSIYGLEVDEIAGMEK